MGKEYGESKVYSDLSIGDAQQYVSFPVAKDFLITSSYVPPKRPRAWVWSVESPERLAELAEEYVTYLETAETDKVCLCLWRIHPDDVALTEKRRRTLVDEHPQCPVHTKAGRLVGFIEWLTGPADGG